MFMSSYRSYIIEGWHQGFCMKFIVELQKLERLQVFLMKEDNRKSIRTLNVVTMGKIFNFGLQGNERFGMG